VGMPDLIYEYVALACVFSLIALLTGAARAAFVPTAFREGVSNTAFYVSDALVMLPILVVISVSLGQALASLGLKGLCSGAIAELPIVVQFMLVVFVSDLIGYWRHRLLHWKWLWPTHAVHHSDTQVHWLTLVRIHPFERIISLIFDLSVLTLIGFPADLIVMNNYLRHYYGYFLHSSLLIDYGPLRHIFVSPRFHRWHHSTDVQGKNFAVIFSFIDRCFGTFYSPDRAPTSFGIDRGDPVMRFPSLLWMPMALWLRYLRKPHWRMLKA
jgi:sterol desaturase/sphingolipid hydroxylase (fatty acid hydroxylase superfamily)